MRFSRTRRKRRGLVVESAPAPQQGSLVPDYTTFIFSATEGSVNPDLQTMYVSNGGPGNLTGPTVGNISYQQGSGWLTVTRVFSQQYPYPVEIAIDTTSMADGQYSATFQVLDTNASNSPYDITVNLTLTPASVAAPYGVAELPRTPSGTPMTWDWTHGGTRRVLGTPLSYSIAQPPAVTGTVYQVSTATEFRTALTNAVNDGDCIEVTSNFTISDPNSLVLRNRTTSGGWVTIRSSGYASLPTYSGNYMTATRASNRVDPTTHAAALKTITVDYQGGGITGISCQNAAVGYWITGIKFNRLKAGNDAMIAIRAASLSGNTANYPRRIVVDRCHIDNQEHGKIGIWADGDDVLISGNYIENNVSSTEGFVDSQAVAWNEGGRNQLIFNNYLDAQSEVIASGSGGTAPSGVQQCTDVAIIRNDINKKSAWDTSFYDGMRKNMFELKHGERVLFMGNVCSHHRTGNQFYTMMFTPSDGTGYVRDINIIGNWFTDVANDSGLFEIAPAIYAPEQQSMRFTVAQNYWDSGVNGASSACQVLLYFGHAAGGAERNLPYVCIEDNTWPAGSAQLSLGGDDQQNYSWTGFRFCNNVNWRAPTYGPVFSSVATNATALDRWPGSGTWTFAKNLQVSGGATWTTGGSLAGAPYNCASDTAANIFQDAAGGDYRIKAGGAYENWGTHGRNPGADINWIVNDLTAGVT